MPSPSPKPVGPIPRRIGIVGGGISDLFEADERLGGHANSVNFVGNGQSYNVDTGFIVMDEKTYPHFSKFLRELAVKTIPTDMSFGVSVPDAGIEWGSYSVKSFVGCISLLSRLWFWRLIFDMLWFSLFAENLLYDGEALSKNNNAAVESIGSYLIRHGYSKPFIEWYLIPMVAAPWCIDPKEFARTFPAKTLIQFASDHGILDSLTRKLRWRSFQNGSKTYIDAFEKQLLPNHRLHLCTPVRRVEKTRRGAIIHLSNGIIEEFDEVVLAVHAEQALELLGDSATALQRRVLTCFKTRCNVCYLHSDASFLPSRPAARVAWNCSLEKTTYSTAFHDEAHPNHRPIRIDKPSSNISVTFDMNRLQAIPGPGEPGSPGKVLVSMNPCRIPKLVRSKHLYRHPLITSESVQMTRNLDEIHRNSTILFAGAWMGFGFHEDGFAAGAHAARLVMDGYDKTERLDLLGLGRNEKKNIVAGSRVIRLVLRIIQILGVVVGEIWVSLQWYVLCGAGH